MTDTNQKEDLATYKAQADLLGIEYPNNITLAKLKAKITEHLGKESVDEANEQYNNLYAENMKLVKVIVTPVDSAKRDYAGEIFAVGNDVLGTVKRFVPFNQEWFIENILYKHIESKEFQFIKTVKDKSTGNEFLESKIIPAYNVTLLPMPTQEELAEMKRIQEAREGVV